ncbi:sterol desaturase family protein [Dyella sp. C11]|uniref:sterol desaturase family protein n=1 Tax=Dyella sp. C11 TaxID=2126991 RepID=UPI0018E567AD|nr:sterol desaturase family protein [Dyella sp. C11]
MFPGDLYQWWLYLSSTLTGLINIGVLVACVMLWVHRKDLQTAWRRMTPRSLRFNLLALTFDTVLILLPLSYLVGVIEHQLLQRGWTLFGGKWAMALPSMVLLALAIFLGDFVAYFRHRFEHSRWLWPAHVMHHSDTDMHWLTVYRFHPINRLSTALIDSCALVMLGLPLWAIVATSAFRHYYGILVHMDLPWTFGPLGNVFVSPAMHRWHHVREGDGVGSNFASVFSVFDRVFGTLYMPGPCNQPLGVTDVDNDSYFKQLAWPFYRAAKALEPGPQTPAVDPNSTN